MTSAHTGFTALIGTWRTRGTIVDDEAAADGADITGQDRYEWLGDRFVVHTADVSVAGRPQHGLEIYTLDGSAFEATAYTDDGSVETVTGSFDGEGIYRAGNDVSRVTLRARDATMTARWEIRREGEWKPWMDMAFHRIEDREASGPS